MSWQIIVDRPEGSMEDTPRTQAQDGPGGTSGHRVSRRRFLQLAGAAGVAVGFGGGIGGLLASCSEEEKPSTTMTAAPITETTTTTLAPSTTTTTTSPETGREIRLGLVSPSSGPLALYGRADDWWVDFAMKALPEGILGGDGRRHMIAVRRGDSRSDATHASQVATQLINVGKVDLMMASGSLDTAGPVAERCEALGCPSIANLIPWQPFLFGRGATLDRSFKWTYAHALGLESIHANYVAMWDQVETNKKVGLICADDADGAAWANSETGLPSALEVAGYTYVLPGLYPLSTADFSDYISVLEREACEICCCAMTTLDFANFWRQAVQQGYNPKVLTVSTALLFPYSIEAIGEIAQNTTAEALWHPTWPFRDSITGMTCRQLAEDYMSQTGEQWTPAIGQYANFEWAVDVFKRVADFDDSEDIIGKVRTTRLRTCLGLMDFSAPVDTESGRHVAGNVYRAPSGGAQWIKAEVFDFEPRMVSNALAAELPVAGRVQPMSYA